MLWAGAAAAAPAGTVIAVSGSCTDHGRVLNHGDVVQVGDALDVPAGGNLKLRMADGSVISVASGSRMTVANYDSAGSGRAAKLLLVQGCWASLRSAPLRGVHCGRHRGGRFASADWFIKAEAGSAQVGVLAGTVDLTSSLTRELVSIPAHWGTRLEAGRAPCRLGYGIRWSSIRSSVSLNDPQL